MNKRIPPCKDEIVKIIDQYKNVKDCIVYFKSGVTVSGVKL